MQYTRKMFELKHVEHRLAQELIPEINHRMALTQCELGICIHDNS